MDNEPDRIWADIDDAEHTRGSMIGRVFSNDIGDIEYVRADIHASALAEAHATIARLEAENAWLKASILALSKARAALSSPDTAG